MITEDFDELKQILREEGIRVPAFLMRRDTYGSLPSLDQVDFCVEVEPEDLDWAKRSDLGLR